MQEENDDDRAFINASGVRARGNPRKGMSQEGNGAATVAARAAASIVPRRAHQGHETSRQGAEDIRIPLWALRA